MNDRVYFHGLAAGQKLKNLRANPKVCFEVTGPHSFIQAEKPCGTNTAYQSVIIMKQLENLLSNYSTAQYNGTACSELFKTVRLHIIPMINPDGVMISEKGIDAIRDETLKANLLSVYQSDLKLGKGSTNVDEYWLTCCRVQEVFSYTETDIPDR